jgi:hypothetical protein
MRARYSIPAPTTAKSMVSKSPIMTGKVVMNV